MTVSALSRTLAFLAFCTYAQSTRLASLGVAGARISVVQRASRNANAADSRLITASGMGRVQLRMTLDEVRRALPSASFRRASDGDGAALVEIGFGGNDCLTVYADEDDAAAPIDWSRKIVNVEAFSAAFHTSEGVHPGSLVIEAEAFFGPVREIVESEIESRQYVTFARQPRALTFRLDYTGIFSPGDRRTTRFAPGAKILSISVSSIL